MATKPNNPALYGIQSEVAEKNGLSAPLLPEVTDDIGHELAIETSQLTSLNNYVQAMAQLLLKGKGLYAFLDALEELLGNPLAIVRDKGRPWLSKSLQAAGTNEQKAMLQALTYRNIGHVTDGAFLLLQTTSRVYVKPVLTAGKTSASLLLLERSKMIVPLDVFCIDKLISLVGLELASNEAITEVEGKYLDQFLQDWLSGRIISEADWKLRSDVCGYSIPNDSQICAVLVECSRFDRTERFREIAGRIRSESVQAVDGLLSTTFADELALIFPVRGLSKSEVEGKDAINQQLSKLVDELQNMLGDSDVRFFVGRCCDQSDGLHTSWSQAKHARQVAQVCGITGNVVSYDHLGVYTLLYLIPPGEEREQFLRRYAIPLQQADRKGGGRLLETLEMYFHCNGNIKLTSEKLFAHYNTVVYRLEKIQTILDISLDDPEDRLQLHLALKLGQITPGSI